VGSAGRRGAISISRRELAEESVGLAIGDLGQGLGDFLGGRVSYALREENDGALAGQLRALPGSVEDRIIQGVGLAPQ
jgi:hypothetical protein